MLATVNWLACRSLCRGQQLTSQLCQEPQLAGLWRKWWQSLKNRFSYQARGMWDWLCSHCWPLGILFQGWCHRLKSQQDFPSCKKYYCTVGDPFSATAIWCQRCSFWIFIANLGLFSTGPLSQNRAGIYRMFFFFFTASEKKSIPTASCFSHHPYCQPVGGKNSLCQNTQIHNLGICGMPQMGRFWNTKPTIW